MSEIDIRDSFFDGLYDLATRDSDVIFISADMDAFSLRRFKKDMPKQYMNIGVAEQNMINVAAGLALTGKKVFCYAIAAFATMRCFEQIKVNLCSLNLPVTIIGAGAGFSFGFDGPTHHGHQDLAIMRLLPEMSIYELSCNALAEKLPKYIYEQEGPKYIRLDKGPFPSWSFESQSLNQGFRVIKPLQKVNLISNGFMARRALEVAQDLESKGVVVGLVDLYQVKPMTQKFLDEVVAKSELLISIEESCVVGGLGTALSEAITTGSFGCRLKCLGAPHQQFIEYASRDWFHEKYKLDKQSLIQSVLSVV